MGRLRSLATVLAGALAAAPAAGAEITRVSSSGEPDSAFDLRVDVRYDRTQRRAKITREFGDNAGVPGIGVVADEAELVYSRLTSRVVPTVHVGLWHDLELRIEVPYVLADDTTWRYETVGGVPLDQVPGTGSAISSNRIDAGGNACAGPCPMFPVGKTFHAGGAFDDVKLGVAWGILNDRKDAFAPSWVVSLDLTVPSAARWDPAADRLTPAAFFDAPAFAAGKRAAVGKKIWVWELATAFSRRMGPVDPYLQAHLRLPQKSSSTYSNCDHATQLADPALGQMASAAPALCRSGAKDLTDADPPLVGGMIFGAELVPYEDRVSSQKFSVDLRLSADLTSAGRWYDELTPATGKLLHNDAYLTAGAELGLRLRASRYITLAVQGTFQYDTPHLITGEGMGKSINDVVGTPTNPNFDYRWDAPGRRFRVTESVTMAVAASAALTF